LSAGGGDEEARAAALVERFFEAGEMPLLQMRLDEASTFGCRCCEIRGRDPRVLLLYKLDLD
jgi:hypothetical protein